MLLALERLPLHADAGCLNGLVGFCMSSATSDRRCRDVSRIPALTTGRIDGTIHQGLGIFLPRDDTLLTLGKKRQCATVGINRS
jgi:hypothetical protein